MLLRSRIITFHRRHCVFLLLLIPAVLIGWWFAAARPITTVQPKKSSSDLVLQQWRSRVPALFTEYVYDVSINGGPVIPFTRDDHFGWQLYLPARSPIVTAGCALVTADTGTLLATRETIEPWLHSTEQASLADELRYFLPPQLQERAIVTYVQQYWDGRNDSEGEMPFDFQEEKSEESNVPVQTPFSIVIKPHRLRIYAIADGNRVTPETAAGGIITKITPHSTASYVWLQTAALLSGKESAAIYQDKSIPAPYYLRYSPDQLFAINNSRKLKLDCQEANGTIVGTRGIGITADNRWIYNQ